MKAALFPPKRPKRRRRLSEPLAAIIQRLEDRTLLFIYAGNDSFDVKYDDIDTSADGLNSVLYGDYQMPPSGTLTAELVDDVSHGSLSLGSDGYFTYTPDDGYVGTDSYTYKATNGVEYSNTATVTLTVTKLFGNRANGDDNPAAGVDSFGVFATSMMTGDLQTAHDVGDGNALIDSSLAASDPIIAAESVGSSGYYPGNSPSSVEVDLTLGGVAKDPVYYSGTYFFGGATFRFALQADASTLDTGHYDWEMDVISSFSGGKTATNVYTGSTNIVKRDDGEFGPDWSLAGLDRLYEQTGGALLVQGDGTAFWFVDNQDDTFTSPAGPLSTTSLVRNVDDSFTLTDKYGNAEEFDADGLLTARVDRNGNSTDYAYTDADGDSATDEISTVTDPYGRVTTFHYTNGFVSSVEDNAGRVTTIGRDGSYRMTSITSEDPDDAGPLSAPVYDYAYTDGRLSSVTDPLDNETTFDYDFAGRLNLATHPDDEESAFAAAQMVGVIDTGSGDGAENDPADLVSNYFPQAVWSDELDHESQYKTDEFGFILEATDPQSHSAVFERDSDGRVTQKTDPDPDGAGGLSAPVTEYSYLCKGQAGSSFDFPRCSICLPYSAAV